jgi:hypothetical protein
VVVVKGVLGRELESPIADPQTMRKTIPITNKINPSNVKVVYCKITIKT